MSYGGDELKWKCLKCEGENFTKLSVGNYCDVGLSKVPLRHVSEVNQIWLTCSHCNQEHKPVSLRRVIDFNLQTKEDYLNINAGEQR